MGCVGPSLDLVGGREPAVVRLCVITLQMPELHPLNHFPSSSGIVNTGNGRKGNPLLKNVQVLQIRRLSLEEDTRNNDSGCL